MAAISENFISKERNFDFSEICQLAKKKNMESDV